MRDEEQRCDVRARQRDVALLKNHDFISVVAEERGIENIGNSPVELVEIELK